MKLDQMLLKCRACANRESYHLCIHEELMTIHLIGSPTHPDNVISVKSYLMLCGLVIHFVR